MSGFFGAKKQRNTEDLESYPNPITPSHVLGDEDFEIFKQKFDEAHQSMRELDDDFEQQEANERISGLGRTHNDPCDRATQILPATITRERTPEGTQTHYIYPQQISILDCCLYAIKSFYDTHGAYPHAIKISHLVQQSLINQYQATFRKFFRKKFETDANRDIKVEYTNHMHTNKVTCVY